MPIELGGQQAPKTPTISYRNPGAQWQAAIVDIGEFHTTEWESKKPQYWKDRQIGTEVTDEPVMSPVVTLMLLAEQDCYTGDQVEQAPCTVGETYAIFLQGAEYMQWKEAVATFTAAQGRGINVGDILTGWREADVRVDKGTRKTRLFHLAAPGPEHATVVVECERRHVERNATELQAPAPAAQAPTAAGPPPMGAPPVATAHVPQVAPTMAPAQAVGGPPTMAAPAEVPAPAAQTLGLQAGEEPW